MAVNLHFLHGSVYSSVLHSAGWDNTGDLCVLVPFPGVPVSAEEAQCAGSVHVYVSLAVSVPCHASSVREGRHEQLLLSEQCESVPSSSHFGGDPSR